MPRKTKALWLAPVLLLAGLAPATPAAADQGTGGAGLAATGGAPDSGAVGSRAVGGATGSGAEDGAALVASPAGATGSAVASARWRADDAASAARSGGRPVEVLSATTERERLLANPDGTWTHEQSLAPQRVRRGTGWIPVDTGLRVTAGAVRPAAAAVDLQFSAGGDGPFARIARGSRSLSLTLPWALPAPVLSGRHATYRNVRPGVDLVVTAEAESFTQVLVAHDRAAAAGLASIPYRVSAPGLTVRQNGGGFVAADAQDRTVFAGPPPRMWDSTGGTSTVDLAGPTARSAVMPMVVGDGTLTVTPVRSMVDDPATVYPLYLDPGASASRNEWTAISSGYPNEEYYKFSGDDGVGLCDPSYDSSCGRDQVKRLVWEFGIPAKVRGARVMAATFKAYETHAYDCTADPVQLWLVGAMSSATNWTNFAGQWKRQLASVNIARRSGCTNGPGWVEFNAQSAAAEAAEGSWTTLTVGLKAANEGSMPGGWKRFRNDAGLAITYNSKPGVPTGLSTDGAGCVTGASRPVISSAAPVLRGTANDPDPDETDLKVAFAWDRWDAATGAWVALGGSEQTALRPGATAQVKVNSGLVNNGRYRWRAQTWDPWSHNGSSGTDGSGYSGYCEFDVDLVGPAVPPTVTSTAYPADGVPHGGVGMTGTFMFGANGVADVVKYRWGWSDPPSIEVGAATAGGTALALLTPPPLKDDPTAGGPTRLFVVSVDRANRISPLREYSFHTNNAPGPVGVWAQAEPAGATSFADTNARVTPRPAAISGVTTGASGLIVGTPTKAGPTVGAYNGGSSYAATGGPVLNTNNSFTVSAWVKLGSSTATYQTAVSQAGSYNSAFYLQKSGSSWAFSTHDSDSAGAISRAARSSYAPVPGRWTQLTGVFDLQGSQLRLYVNGVLAGTDTRVTPWNAAGALQFGRERSGNAFTNHWSGELSNVQVWDRVLSPAEIAPLAATRVARWSLDGDGTDRTAYGRTLTATGNPQWTEDVYQFLPGAVELDGGSQWLATSGSAIRTDNSYTVAAWVNLREADTNARTVVAQDGNYLSAFYLGYRSVSGVGLWSFSAKSSDSVSGVGTWTNATVPMAATDVGEWIHLAGVYDATLGQLRLYVNGELRATAAYTAGWWYSAGPLTIGRGLYTVAGGTASVADQFPGAVDDVQVFAGALPATEIAKLR